MPLMLTRSLFTEVGLSNGTMNLFKELVYNDEVEEHSYNNFKSNIMDKTIFQTNTMNIRFPLYVLLKLINPILLPELKGSPPILYPFH